MVAHRRVGLIVGVEQLLVDAIGADTQAQTDAIRAEYVAKYGEENADYLMEVLGAWQTHYGRGAFVAVQVPATQG